MSSKYEALIVANLYKVSKGMVIKNYKELCNVFEMDVKKGKGKSLQLKQLERYFKLSKDGNKYIVSEVYDEPLPPNNKNIKKFLSESYPDFYSRILDVNMYRKEDLYMCAKVVVKWECIICDDIFEKSVFDMMKSKSVRCSKCTGSTGEKLISKILRELELYYKKEIKFDGLVSDKGKSLRFDFGIYVDSKLLCIIEYDGQFHDESDIIKYHDKIKDKYCSYNNIPLLRIHHSIDKNSVKMMIVRFVYGIYNTYRLKELIDVDNEIINRKVKIKELTNEIYKLSAEINELERKINY